MTPAEERAIRTAAGHARALSESLLALVTPPPQAEPDMAIRCPRCKSTQFGEAGDVLVCADCNHNFQPQHPVQENRDA